MDAENKPAEKVAGAATPAANDKSTAQWSLILLVLGAVGVVLVVGILALQVGEYLFYEAPPGVWPQQSAGDTISAPAALPAPLSPATTTTPSDTSAPVEGAASAPAPAAATP